MSKMTRLVGPPLEGGTLVRIRARVKAVATSPSVSTCWDNMQGGRSGTLKPFSGCSSSSQRNSQVSPQDLTLSSVPVGKKGRTRVNEPTKSLRSWKFHGSVSAQNSE